MPDNGYDRLRKATVHHYQGYVEGENIYLAASSSGILVKRPVNRGQWVKKGDLIFQLDDNLRL